MKKLLIVLGLVIASFAFNSCEAFEDLKNRECEDEFMYHLSIDKVRVQLVSSTLASIDIHWDVEKHYCNGDVNIVYVYEMSGSLFNDNQYAEQKLNFYSKLNHKDDYILFIGTLQGDSDKYRKVATQRFDYTDFPDGKDDITTYVDMVFDID